MLTHLVTGLLTGWSLIIAVGPQNALLLRQGIRREHLGVVVTICIVADVLLIGAGTVGIGAIVLLAPWALEILRWLGVAYLLWFAWTSLRSAREQPRHGAQVSTVGLTIPTVLVIGMLTDQQIVLAESPINLALLAITLLVSVIGFAAKRVTAAQGAAHIIIFVVFGLALFA